VGAWRRELIDRCGGFSAETLAEDQDLTLKIRRLGYKIGYEEGAIGWTEAPDKLGMLARQRFRWAYGTLQCVWKHRDAMFRRKYGALGFIGLPNVWIFQIIFPLISPIMDLILIYTLVASASIAWNNRRNFRSPMCDRWFFTTRCSSRLTGRPRLLLFCLNAKSVGGCSGGCSSSVSATGK
jgi:cellulose synthase/poly-beta-1,6-N-acetylglucosamine synthase-like glycosyltransferase